MFKLKLLHFITVSIPEPLLCTQRRKLRLRGASQVALVVKNLPATAGDLRDTGSIPRWGRSSGGRRGNPFQYSCLENPMVLSRTGGEKGLR